MKEHTFTFERAQVREENPWQIDVRLRILDEDGEEVGKLRLDLFNDYEILNWEDACNFFDGDDYPWFLRDLLSLLDSVGYEWTGEVWGRK